MTVAAVAMLCSAPAWAGERYDVRSVAVSVADLDLSTSAGLAELYRRVDRAVGGICGGDRDCRDEAWESTEAQARVQIDNDRWIRRLARERAEQLRACAGRPCVPARARAPAPAYYPPPIAYPQLPATTVTVVVTAPGPVRILFR